MDLHLDEKVVPANKLPSWLNYHPGSVVKSGKPGLPHQNYFPGEAGPTATPETTTPTCDGSAEPEPAAPATSAGPKSEGSGPDSSGPGRMEFRRGKWREVKAESEGMATLGEDSEVP